MTKTIRIKIGKCYISRSLMPGESVRFVMMLRISMPRFARVSKKLGPKLGMGLLLPLIKHFNLKFQIPY